MTAADLSRVHSAFDALPVTSDPAFRRLWAEGRLRYTDQDAKPDLIDEFSARLVCSALMARSGASILIVLPDEALRRSALLFSATLIMDGLAQIETGTVDRRVLYVSSRPGIRSQLGNVRVGNAALDTVFTQQVGRGLADKLRTVSNTGAINLPSVVCIYAPADPASLLRQHKPKWIAVDCAERHELPWLPRLLTEAERTTVPVVGWTTQPFSEAVAQWLEAGGGVFRWPRLRRGVARITDLEQIVHGALQAQVTPRILVGEHVVEISKGFATATEALLAAREFQDGRLSADAIMLGWRYLRAIESIPVPLEVYEREANSYWGMRRIADLRQTFVRFVEAIHSPKIHATLQVAADALWDVQEKLEKSESPLWLGLANLCIESSNQRKILFSSRSRREMFSFCLLARFNISEDDLKDVGVRLGYLTERTDGEPDPLVENFTATAEASTTPLVVGLPSRFAERCLEPFLQSGQLEVLVWPHQVSILERRMRHLSSELTLASRKLSKLLPSLDGLEEREIAMGTGPLTLSPPREATAGPLGELRRKQSVSLWSRPDAFEAIATLIGALPQVEDEERYAPPTLLREADEDSASPLPSDDPWVQEAFEIQFEGGQRVILPTDETVNVIVRNPAGTEVEQRYVHSLRPRDEILFIHGQRRQSLYELLVSRVHRDPVIAQYLALVRRWQDDLVRAFTERERHGGISPESLLEALRERGSGLTSPHTIRAWLRRQVLAPNDADDLKRLAEALSLGFVKTYYMQIHKAGRRLKGLHIGLSARLNRWLGSGEAGAVTTGEPGGVVDADLGLTVEDFRHSLLRLRVLEMKRLGGPFYRPHLGRLEGGGL